MQSFPDAALQRDVPVAVPVVKILMLILIATKYSDSKLQPFTRVAYQFGAAAAICKLAFFAMYYLGDASFGGNGFPGTLLQDLSFCLALTGVVVTLALDFLWSLSSSMEKGALFHHEWVASDVALTWYMIQVPLIVGLASIRHLPLPCDGNVALEFSIMVVLICSFGFVWYCLWKVRGASDSEDFKAAYKAAFYVNVLCTCLVMQNSFFFLVFYDHPDFLLGYKLQEHAAETLGVFVMMCYFMYVKQHSQAIHDHMHDLDKKKSSLQHKSTFGGLLGIQCEGVVGQQSGAGERLLK